MPTYEYKCNACGEEHEIIQRMSENPKRKCPSCGKLRLARQISKNVGVIFKGDGFYCNDYPKEDK